MENNPRFPVLEWALRQWKTEIGNAGFDLGDVLDNFLRMTFYFVEWALGEILPNKWGWGLFANSGPEVAQILDKFVKAVGKVGLRLNVDKTVILTKGSLEGNDRCTK